MRGPRPQGIGLWKIKSRALSLYRRAQASIALTVEESELQQWAGFQEDTLVLPFKPPVKLPFKPPFELPFKLTGKHLSVSWFTPIRAGFSSAF